MMQCKDIPDRPILEFVWSLNNANRWANWTFDDDADVRNAMPALPSQKLAWAKMNQLIRRGVMDGCTCGCRGDYVVTLKGCQEIGRPMHARSFDGEDVF